MSVFNPSMGYGIYFDTDGTLHIAVASEIPKGVPKEVLSPEDIRYYLDNTKIPFWYSPYTPGTTSALSSACSKLDQQHPQVNS